MTLAPQSRSQHTYTAQPRSRRCSWSRPSNATASNCTASVPAGRHDQIVAAIDRRFGGLVDALTLRGDGAGEVPPDLVQDIRRLPHAFRSYP
jgi:hypothetical protein